MKSLIILNILLGIILVFDDAVAANNITMGCVLPNERLLASKSVFKSGTLLGTYKLDIVYPAKTNPHSDIVSRIVVMDYGSPENFAYFSLVSGGPGKKHATIRLQSQTSKSLNCTIKFFGHK